MLENENTIQTEEIDTNKQYIDAINDLKANTVSRDRYNQMVAERDSLLNTLVSGEQLSTDSQQPEVEKVPIENLVDELRNKRHNLDAISYVEKALEFRDRVLEEQGIDCFVSEGHKVVPSEESYRAAEKTAQIYRECLEYAGGDNKVFINELQRRMIDTGGFANRNNLNNRRF